MIPVRIFNARNIHELGRKIKTAAYNKKLPSIYSPDTREVMDAMLTTDSYRRPAARELLLKPCLARLAAHRVTDAGIAVPLDDPVCYCLGVCSTGGTRVV